MKVVLRRVAPYGLPLLLLAVVACSPEESRQQGGGPGADVGNRSPSPELHGQPNMFYKTPALVPQPR